MTEMKSGEVVLSFAAQLAFWRAVLVLLRTWATCKLWQRQDLHHYALFLALAGILNQSQQTVCETAGGGFWREFRKVGEGQRKLRYADVDGPGTNREPELGPRGRSLKKQALKRWVGLDLCSGLQPADSVDARQHCDWEREPRAVVEDSSSKKHRCEKNLRSLSRSRAPVRRAVPDSVLGIFSAGGQSAPFVNSASEFGFEAMDPAGSPSSVPKVADPARPSASSPSAAPVAGWRGFFCLGNGK